MNTASLSDWLRDKILDWLKVKGVFSILPFNPEIGIGPGAKLGHIRITLDAKINGNKVRTEWTGDPLDLKDDGPIEVLRTLQEKAIREGFLKDLGTGVSANTMSSGVDKRMTWGLDHRAVMRIHPSGVRGTENMPGLNSSTSPVVFKSLLPKIRKRLSLPNLRTSSFVGIPYPLQYDVT